MKVIGNNVGKYLCHLSIQKEGPPQQNFKSTPQSKGMDAIISHHNKVNRSVTGLKKHQHVQANYGFICRITQFNGNIRHIWNFNYLIATLESK
jgi:hypothetical protein